MNRQPSEKYIQKYTKYSWQERGYTSPSGVNYPRADKRAINIKKSSDLGWVPSRLQKDGAEALAEPLSLLMNRTINKGSVPSLIGNIL